MKSRMGAAVAAYGRDPVSREQLIAQHLPLVHHVVGRLAIGASSVLDREDLIAHGVIGLIQAIDRYDPAKGVPFAAYAAIRIRGAMLDAIRSLDIMNAADRSQVRGLEQVVGRLTTKLGRMPSEAEIQAEAGLDDTAYARALEAASWSVVSLDASLDDQRAPLADVIADATAGDDPSDRTTTLAAVSEGLRRLDDRERVVLSLYYVEDLTFQEIAAVLGVHKTVAVRLHGRAILKLRSWLTAESPNHHDEVASPMAITTEEIHVAPVYSTTHDAGRPAPDASSARPSLHLRGARDRLG